MSIFLLLHIPCPCCSGYNSLPLVGSAKDCLQVLNDDAISNIHDAILSKFIDRLRPIGKAWSLKTSKLPNPTDEKCRKRYAGKLYFQPLPPVPDDISAFLNDAFRFSDKCIDVSKEWCRESTNDPPINAALLSLAQLLKSMALCTHGITEKGLESLSAHRDIAISFCSNDSRLTTFLKSLPTAYLCNASLALQQGTKLKAECRSSALGYQNKIRSMKTVDDLASLLSDMSTEARLEVDSPEIEGKYDIIRETFDNYDFSGFEEGTNRDRYYILLVQVIYHHSRVY